MFKNKKGFTLIELLVVIAIIGILASIVLASLNTARKKSRDARRVADIKEIQLALELYFDAIKSYPLSASWTTSLSPTYISVVPSDPSGFTYTYEACNCAGPSGPCSTYHLGAVLEDLTNPALSNDLNGGAPSGCSGNWGLDLPSCSGAAGVCTTAGLCCYDVIP